MEINPRRELKTVIFGSILLSILGCTSTSKLPQVQTDFGYKTIFIGPNIRMEEFKRVLNDWQYIADAIYRFKQIDCARDNLSMDTLTALGMYTNADREKYLARAGVNNINGMIRVLEIVTDDPCNDDPSSSDPTWVVVHTDENYIVVGELSLSE